MNKVFFITCFCFLFACSQGDNSNSKLLKGEWRWASSGGGIAGEVLTPQTEGHSAKLVFDGKQATFYRNNNQVGNSKYQLQKRKSIYFEENKDFIVYDKKRMPDVIIYLVPDTLVLGDNLFDGYTSVYIRSK